MLLLPKLIFNNVRNKYATKPWQELAAKLIKVKKENCTEPQRL